MILHGNEHLALNDCITAAYNVIKAVAATWTPLFLNVALVCTNSKITLSQRTSLDLEIEASQLNPHSNS